MMSAMVLWGIFSEAALSEKKRLGARQLRKRASCA